MKVKMDQVKECVVVHWVKMRSFGKQDWTLLKNRIVALKGDLEKCVGAVEVIQK